MPTKPKMVIGITLAKPGGATSFVFGFASWLQQQGYEPIILAGEGEWLFEQCRRQGLSCLRVPFLEREISWKDLFALFHMWNLFRKLKPDVVHLNSTKMGVIGSMAARGAGIPHVVYCIAGWVFLEALSHHKKNLYTLIERWTAPLKDTIICLHTKDVAAAKARNIKPRGEFTSIPNGIDLAFFDQHLQTADEARQSLGLPNGIPVFGTISNFYPPKNLPNYIDTCALVHAQYPDALFVIIGDGMERSLIEKNIKKHHLEASVLLLGSKEHAWKYMRAFNAYVLPSVKEGMPFTLLEAMAASLPCIVTDVGANAWTLTSDGGWIVPAHATIDLAHTMMEALQNSERAHTYGKRARIIVEQRFPLEKTYQSHLNILLNPPSSRSR